MDKITEIRIEEVYDKDYNQNYYWIYWSFVREKEKSWLLEN